MENILDVVNLTKRYRRFTLENVSFSLPHGSIMGLIGENGAGKTTTIHAILGLINIDAGNIRLFGEPLNNAVKEKIGVVPDTFSYHPSLTAKQVSGIMSAIYKRWDRDLYSQYLERFVLPTDKKLKEFSTGMKKKLAIICALSHRPQLLVMDEATSGLDPVVRDDILELLLEFIQEESNSVLFSSHITSDLEKVADYITFIHEGKILFSDNKDTLLGSYGILKCGNEQIATIDKQDIEAVRRLDYSCNILVRDRKAVAAKYKGLVVDSASLDDIMVFYGKGEAV